MFRFSSIRLFLSEVKRRVGQAWCFVIHYKDINWTRKEKSWSFFCCECHREGDIPD